MPKPPPRDVDPSRIVVVDDNVPSAELVKALLARVGMPSVELINSPRELLARFEELNPHLVVLDLHMPGIDGYTVLAELRSRAPAPDLPVLVLTADTTRDATHRALSLGANDFLTKPLDAVELTLRVRNLLAARAAHEGLLQRQRWLEASAELAGDLLSGVSKDPLRRLCELARVAADADSAQIVAAVERRGPSAGPFLIVPLGAGSRDFGALQLGRAPGRPEFTDGERLLAAGFAHQAAVGVELAEAQADQERMVVLRDRHRIARDLHDHVIQRLFAAGLRLEQASKEAGDGPLARSVQEHLEDLDDTISEIRSTVFELQRAASADPNALENRLSELDRALAGVLGEQSPGATDAAAGPAIPRQTADETNSSA